MRLWQVGFGGSLLTGLILIALFPPLDLRWLAPLALTPLLYSLWHEPSAWWRFLYAWAGGFLYWGVICHWIRDTLYAYGGLAGPLSWLALFLFAVVKGLHLGFFGICAGPLMRTWWAIPTVAALWVGIERTHGPLGFAWLALGNAGVDMAVPMRLAPFTGVYGLSFLFAAVAAAVARLALRQGRRESAWLLPFAGILLLPSYRPSNAPVESVVSLQPAIAESDSWTEGEKDRMVSQLSYRTLAEALNPQKPKPRLVLWPEAPAPLYYYQDAKFRQQAGELARLIQAPFLFAGVAYTPEMRPLNSAILLTREGRLAGRYDKMFLVPFGEFVPPGFGWINKVSNEAGDFERGRSLSVFPLDEGILGVFICYESAFPHLVRQFANAGADVLVNLTNDGYFGRSSARPQHLLLARMRAAENRRYLLRCANDGITASINPAGQIVTRLPEFERTAARLPYQRERAKTFYTEHGDWFVWTALLLGLGAAGVALFRKG